ncbi:hypothetical protein NN561_006473 [Cricetulus griseus]
MANFEGSRRRARTQGTQNRPAGEGPGATGRPASHTTSSDPGSLVCPGEGCQDARMPLGRCTQAPRTRPLRLLNRGLLVPTALPSGAMQSQSARGALCASLRPVLAHS